MKKRKETISRFELNNLIREGKKYRYYFFDYLYYRLYVGYRRHNEPARISSCLFLGMICIILFGFLGLFFNKVLNYDWLLDNFTPIQVKGIFVGLGIFFPIAFFIRYNRKRTTAILLKYKGNIWNKIIPAWIIYLSPILIFFICILMCKILFHLKMI
ncbi:hypothetical protein B5F78_01885 [Bacteroides sp. An279]|nr:hypothetical protein B5F78_01885 [Bacteroides sp. An279]